VNEGDLHCRLDPSAELNPRNRGGCRYSVELAVGKPCRLAVDLASSNLGRLVVGPDGSTFANLEGLEQALSSCKSRAQGIWWLSWNSRGVGCKL
jgi:hypothetical protein